MLKRFCAHGLEHWGADDRGVRSTRRFLLEWLSFTHRYVPVGVLDRVPVGITREPPTFVGRSDLETLLSSSDPGDWVKISTMLLGPTPSDFSFAANAQERRVRGAHRGGARQARLGGGARMSRRGVCTVTRIGRTRGDAKRPVVG